MFSSQADTDSVMNYKQLVVGAALGASTVLLTYQAYKHYKQRQSQSTTLQTDTTQEIASSPIRGGERLLSNDTQGSSFEEISTPTQVQLNPVTRFQGDQGGEIQVDSSVIVSTSENDESKPMLDLLYNIAQEQARKDAYMHRSVTCNVCSQSPLCGIRYKCVNCIDYDICERCEPKDEHNKTHTLLRITVPLPPLANTRKPLLKVLYPGKKTHSGPLPYEEILNYKQASYFDTHEIEAIYEQYKCLLTSEKGISREVFDQCLGPLADQKNLVVDRLFKFYDKNNDKHIDFSEMVSGLSLLVKGSQQEKMPYAFEGYDIENKGYISKDNLRRMFKAYFNITIELVRDVVKGCEEEMMANFDESSGRPISALFSAPLPSDSMNNNQKGKGDIPANPGGREGMWPVMEAMSQDAIDEMANNLFKIAKLKDGQRMTYDKFKVVALVDPSLIAWFDALGTVF